MSYSASFAQLSLPAPILKCLEERGYEAPFPIQSEAIPFLLEGSDLIGQAQTGTGKTAAFALPLLSRLKLIKKQTQVLVLTPTRELAIQVSESFLAYSKYLKDVQVLPIYGGQSYSGQLNGLKNGIHVVVGTPGRILDHLQRGSLKMDEISTVVLDEADEMLRMGFIDDVENIVSQAPASAQMVMFSATMPNPIRSIAKRYLKEPHEVKIAAETVTVARTDQFYMMLNHRQKPEALTRLLQLETYDGALVFVRTKTATVEVAEHLVEYGFAVAALNGDMNQSARERTVNQLKQRKLNIVVATDVAARGLDVDRLSLVINYDVPFDNESYVHRIGRTGRAGRGGRAILFITRREKSLLHAIEKAIHRKIDFLPMPSDEELEENRKNLFKEQVIQSLASQPLHLYHQQLEQIKKELNVSLEELVPALLYLAQKENPLPLEKKITEPLLKPKTRSLSEKKASNPKTERRGHPKKTKKKNSVGIRFDCYRLEMGKHHNVRVADIVGAIANEADIESQYIGNIKMYDKYSTVELPEGMPKAIFQHLKKVSVRQRKMCLSLIH